MKNKILSLVLVAVLIFALTGILNAQSTVTLEGVLPGISSELGGSYAINIAMTQSTVGLDVSEESAVTNTLYEVESVTHTTSGTPANGIGVKKTWTQETSASNNEDVGYFGWEVTDTTAASEDASFVVGNMAAGAAAAQVLEVTSVGVVELVGAATLDNATAATELNITETNIQLTGAIDMEGGNVKINEDSGDYDFAIETDSTDDAFSIDSGASTLDTDGLTVTFNQAGGDYDFTVESDGDPNAIQVDAGNDRVGILTAAPTVPFEVTGNSLITGNLSIASGALALEQCTIAADDVTPDVAGCTWLTTSANTGATAITDLDNPVVGTFYCIIGGSDTSSSTIADSGNFALSGAFTAGLDDVLCLYVQADNDYIEISVSDN